MIKVKVDLSWIKHISEENIKKWANNGIRDLLIFMEGIAVKVTPKDTWFLRKGFKSKQSNLKWSFFNNVKYAKFVNDWTKSYTIKRKNKRVLSNGKSIFWKQVKHPWIKANPFMENIQIEAEKIIEKIFIKNISKELW